MKRRVMASVLAILVLVTVVVLQGGRASAVAGNITTVAGANTFCGDGGAATGGCLNLPVALAFDTGGNLLITDNANQRIRKVTAAGTLSTLAGSGNGRYCGDGVVGGALSACFEFPLGIVADSTGNVYVSDSNNDRVRKIAVDGTVTTYAGTGACTGVGDGSLATAACLNSPRGLALDSAGNLYISDGLHSRVRVVNNVTNVITTFAGTGVNSFCGDGGAAASACLYHPRGIRFDTAGNLFIADESNNRVRRVDAGTLNISTVAGSGTRGFGGDGGAAAAGALDQPRGVAFDPSGAMYIADGTNDRIRKVVTGGDGLVNGAGSETITTFAGNGSDDFCGDGGPATSACMDSPDDVTFDGSGNLYVADALNHRVRKVTPGATITTFAGSQTFCGDGGPATAACLNNPQGVLRRGPSDPLYVADTINHRIRVVNGATMTTFAGTGTPGFSGDNGPAASAQLFFPRGMAMNAAGDLYIADSSNQRIRRIDHAMHVITTVAGNGIAGGLSNGAPLTATLKFPKDVFIDAGGNLYIADSSNHAVREVTPGADGIVNGSVDETITTVAGNGTLGDCVDGTAALNGCLKYPHGIFVDGSGILIADTSNHKVKLVAGGTIRTITGSGTASSSGDAGAATAAGVPEPSSVVKDHAGNLFISSHAADRIRKVTPGLDGAVNGSADDVISTVVGGITTAYCGDGAAASAACLTLPRAITLDSAGNLYIADQGNRRVREVEALGVTPGSSVGGIAVRPDLPAVRGNGAASDAGGTGAGGARWYGIAATAGAGAVVLVALAWRRRRGGA